MADERTESVELTFGESGTLCHLLMNKMVEVGGVELKNIPEQVIKLYEKLAATNDRLRGR